MDSPLFASGIHNCEERVCCHISGFFSGTSKVPSLDGCRAAAPMHSHGLINQPMTIIRFCCCGGDHFRPSVGVSCYAIQGEKNLMKLFFYAPPPLYEILMANALGQLDICDAVLKGGVHTIIPDSCYRESRAPTLNSHGTNIPHPTHKSQPFNQQTPENPHWNVQQGRSLRPATQCPCSGSPPPRGRRQKSR